MNFTSWIQAFDEAVTIKIDNLMQLVSRLETTCIKLVDTKSCKFMLQDFHCFQLQTEEE